MSSKFRKIERSGMLFVDRGRLIKGPVKVNKGPVTINVDYDPALLKKIISERKVRL